MTSYAFLLAMRRRAGLSQPELAERIGAHPNSISRYERGGGYPSSETLAAWLEVCAATDGEIVAVLRAIIAERKTLAAQVDALRAAVPR